MTSGDSEPVFKAVAERGLDFGIAHLAAICAPMNISPVEISFQRYVSALD
jgi:hypothetical protein